MKRPVALLAPLMLCAALALPGCAGPQPEDYAAEKPVLELKQYFDGELTAHGMFTDRSGKVLRRFVVALKCSWQGDDGVLEEDFVFSDGETQRRVWRLKALGGGRYSGTADDVIGVAEGRAAGNALNWRYTLRLPVNDDVYDVQFDDWMFLIDHNVMLNKAVMSKFGIRLGEVTLAFYRKPT